MYMEKRMSLLEFRCKVRGVRVMDFQTAEKLGIEIVEREYLALKDQRKRTFVDETKTIISYCGSWNDKPKTPRGSVDDFVWSELVMDQLKEARVPTDTGMESNDPLSCLNDRAAALDLTSQCRNTKEEYGTRGDSIANSSPASVDRVMHWAQTQARV